MALPASGAACTWYAALPSSPKGRPVAQHMHVSALLTMMAVMDSLASSEHMKRTCKGAASCSQNSLKLQAWRSGMAIALGAKSTLQMQQSQQDCRHSSLQRKQQSVLTAGIVEVVYAGLSEAGSR